MANLSSSRPIRPAHARRAGSTFWAAIHDLVVAIIREREIRRSVNELATWNDHMLSDIGLTRGDIERTVRFGRM